MTHLYCLECGEIGPETNPFEPPPIWFCGDHDDLRHDAVWWAERLASLKSERAQILHDALTAEEHLHGLLHDAEDEEEVDVGPFRAKKSTWNQLNIKRTANYLKTYHPDLFHKLSAPRPSVWIERRT